MERSSDSRQGSTLCEWQASDDRQPGSLLKDCNALKPGEMAIKSLHPLMDTCEMMELCTFI